MYSTTFKKTYFQHCLNSTKPANKAYCAVIIRNSPAARNIVPKAHIHFRIDECSLSFATEANFGVAARQFEEAVIVRVAGRSVACYAELLAGGEIEVAWPVTDLSLLEHPELGHRT